MTTEAAIDFNAIKSAAAIDTVLRTLSVPKLVQHGDQFRAPCPTCKTGGDRALVVTVSKRSFYCFANKRGGDCIALVAHVRGMSQRDAAMYIVQRLQLGNLVDKGERRAPSSSSPEPTGRGAASPVFRAMEPLLYLDAHHESVAALGITSETAEHFKAGYAGRGTLRGRFCVPIHAIDGMLIAYVGIATSDEQQPRLLFNNFEPDRYMFNLERVTGEDGVYVARDPLEVLKAFENGVENVISFLSPITAAALDVLSVWMHERQVENVEIL